jgi:hypothetical protein
MQGNWLGRAREAKATRNRLDSIDPPCENAFVLLSDEESEMTQREKIVEEALALSPEDRAYVADVIEQSLSDGGFATPEIAAAWAEEIERRIAAYERGEASADDARVSLNRMRRKLAEHRAGQVSP